MGITPYWAIGASDPDRKVKKPNSVYIRGGPVGMLPEIPDLSPVEEDDEWKKWLDWIGKQQGKQQGKDKKLIGIGGSFHGQGNRDGTKDKMPWDDITVDDIDWSDWRDR